MEIRRFWLVLAVCLAVCIFASAATQAQTFTGKLSSGYDLSGPAVQDGAHGKLVGLPNCRWVSYSAFPTTISWTVTRKADSWHYDYTLQVPVADPSRIIVEASEPAPGEPSFTKDDIYNPSDPFDSIIVDWQEYSGNNQPHPGMPASVYGIRFEAGNWGLTARIQFDSPRAPVWGDFYAKDGSPGGAVWNLGFTDADPLAPAASGSINHHILRPGEEIWLGSTRTITTSLTANPAYVPATGTHTSTLAVRIVDSSGNPESGKQIAFSSSRGAADLISQPSSPTNSSGIVTGSICSSTIGTATITAVNVTDNQSIPASASVTFFDPTQPGIMNLKTNPVPVVTAGAGLAYTCRAEVYWGGSPGQVVFSINGAQRTVSGTSDGATLSINMADLLWPASPGGSRHNQITARAFNTLGKVSSPVTVGFPVVSLPQWLSSSASRVGPINTRIDSWTNQLTLSADIRVPSGPINSIAIVPETLPGLGGKWGTEIDQLKLRPSISVRPGASSSQPVTGSFSASASWGASVSCGRQGGGISSSVSASGGVTPIRLARAQGNFSGNLTFSTPRTPLPPPVSFICWQARIKPQLHGSVAFIEGQPELIPGTNLRFDNATLGLSPAVEGALSAGAGVVYVEGGIGARPSFTAQFPANYSSYCWTPYLRDARFDVYTFWKARFWAFQKQGSYSWTLLRCPSGMALEPMAITTW